MAAAIVAQITKANWERQKNRHRPLPADKCVYYIPPFDPTFVAEKHNHYLRRKVTVKARHHDDQIVDEVRTEIERLAKEIEEELDQGSPNHVQICKALAGASLVLIPMSIAIFLMLTFMSI